MPIQTIYMDKRTAACHCFMNTSLWVTGIWRSGAMPKKIVLFSMLLFSIVIHGMAQTDSLPLKFYNLTSDGEKAAYLGKVIGDSVKIGAYKYVPSWTHMALALAAKSEKDTLSPILYQYLGDAYDGKQNDSAAYYYRLSLSSFKNITFKKKLYLQQSLLYTYTALNKKDSILFYIHELERSVAPVPDTSEIKLNITNTIASSYSALGIYKNAIKNFRFVIQHSSKSKNSSIRLNALVNVGSAYSETDNYPMAIYWTLQALPYLGDDVYSKMFTYNNLASYYQSSSRLDSAKLFLSKADVIARELKDEEAMHAIALTKAAVLILEHKYAAAEPLLQKSLAYLQDQEPGTQLVNCLLLYATLDTLQRKFNQAEDHLLTLYKITEGTPIAYRAENLRMLASVNEKLGDYKDAYTYQKQMIVMNDSIKSEKVQQSFVELQTEYQAYKKQEQINLLQKEGLIKDLELQAALRDKTLFIILGIILLAAFLLILYIRSLRSKTALQNLKADLEMKALRSQMNPHFIFNSLNSIQKYIWENRQEDASEYLAKFARLIRLVLENSLHTSVKLTEELSALRIYVEMEHRRNNQKFDYSITLADNIDVDNTHIPPLILQPYVENAIWHGLSQKEGRGKLSIVLEKKGTALLCMIDDDGIGRTRSAEIKVNQPHKTSLAMNISSQRIAWLQKDAGLQASVAITDKYTGTDANGTTVLLTLPLIVKHD